MKFVQYKILTRILDRIKIPSYVFGFEKGKSIPQMAKTHVGKDVVISLDIKDYFPSIKQFMVEQAFREIGIQTKPARLLSELCTYKAYVPQGSLTAPKTSNLITAGTFGREIYEYYKNRGVAVTVYADDITLSYNIDKQWTKEESKEFARELISNVTNIVKKYGFEINTEKTKIMRRNTRQWVCGTVVNEKVNLKRIDRYQLKAIVNNCRKNGILKEAEKAGMEPEAFIRKYAGRINWLCQLNMDFGAILKKNFRKVATEYLLDKPSIEIPELSWNSTIENLTTESELEVDFEDGTIKKNTLENIPAPF